MHNAFGHLPFKRVIPAPLDYFRYGRAMCPIHRWCDETLQEAWDANVESPPSGVLPVQWLLTFHFESDEDAVLFTLRWF